MKKPIKKARAPGTKAHAPKTKTQPAKAKAVAPKAKAKPIASAPTAPDATQNLTTIDFTDAPELLEAFGIDPRLFRGVEPMLVSFGPREALEARGLPVFDRPERGRTAEAVVFGMMAKARERPRRPRPAKSTTPPPNRRPRTAK